MVLKNFLAFVVFKIISNLVSTRNSLNAYNCWHEQNFENCPTLLIVGSPQGFYGRGGAGGRGGRCWYWRFLKILSKGGLKPIAILAGISFFRGLRAYHVNLETFFNLSSIVVVSKPFVGASLFIFLDDIALKTICRSFFIYFLRRHSS